MQPLTRADLMSLETYALQRSEFRATVLAHKAPRKVSIGPNATLYFEDRLTMQYQIQEMLRIERIFEADAIQEELDAYNPLIPSGSNWKATFMLEFPNEAERKQWLKVLVGIERQVWVQVGDHELVWGIADEDLARENDEKTASVHFVRFELTPSMVSAARQGAVLKMGIEHPEYAYKVTVKEETRESLAADLD